MNRLNIESATECGSNTEFALGDHCAVMRLHDVLHDRKAESRAGRGARTRPVDDVEALEDVRQRG